MIWFVLGVIITLVADGTCVAVTRGVVTTVAGDVDGDTDGEEGKGIAGIVPVAAGDILPENVVVGRGDEILLETSPLPAGTGVGLSGKSEDTRTAPATAMIATTMMTGSHQEVGLDDVLEEGAEPWGMGVPQTVQNF